MSKKRLTEQQIHAKYMAILEDELPAIRKERSKRKMKWIFLYVLIGFTLVFLVIK